MPLREGSFALKLLTIFPSVGQSQADGSLPDGACLTGVELFGEGAVTTGLVEAVVEDGGFDGVEVVVALGVFKPEVVASEFLETPGEADCEDRAPPLVATELPPVDEPGADSRSS